MKIRWTDKPCMSEAVMPDQYILRAEEISSPGAWYWAVLTPQKTIRTDANGEFCHTRTGAKETALKAWLNIRNSFI